MKEHKSEAVICLCCGSRAGGAPGPRATALTADEEWRRVESFARAAPPAPRRRSGLAYGAGYAGVAYLFGFAFGPFTQAVNGTRLSAFLSVYAAPLPLTLWNLWAPLALVLAFAAGYSIDTSRDREGALPALLGLLVGLWGTIVWFCHLFAPAGPASAGL